VIAVQAVRATVSGLGPRSVVTGR